MRRLILMFIIMTMVAAGAASGNTPSRLSTSISKAKNFFWGNQSLPTGWQKIIWGTAAVGILLTQPLAPVNAYQQEHDTVLLADGIDQELKQLKKELKGEQMSEIKKEMKELLSKIRETQPSDPEFNDLVVEGEETLAILARIVSILGEASDHDDLHATQKLFNSLTDGVRVVERHGIVWTTKYDTVGIDYRDVEHYLAVKDTLTAQDYDGVSIHYFVDGKSYRGVATAVHDEVRTKVRVGEMFIDVAQISGVRITNRPDPRPWLWKKHATNNIYWEQEKRDYSEEITTDMIAEPHDLAKLVETVSNSTLIRDKDTSFTWKGYPREGERRDYTDGYGEFSLIDVTLLNKAKFKNSKWRTTIVSAEQYRHGKAVEYRDGWYYRTERSYDIDDVVVLVNFDKRPLPTVRVRNNIAWDNHQSDVFATVYGDHTNVLGIRDAYLEYYLKVKDTLSATDYTGALVRYRQGNRNLTAQVTGAHRGADNRAVVVDLVTGKKKVIDVADIAGVLLMQHAGGEAATIDVGNATYQGEVMFSFSNEEVSVLVHAKREGEDMLELLDDKHTLTVQRTDEGLILH